MGGKPVGGVFESANLNLYAYVHQRPSRLRDPSGLHPTSTCTYDTSGRGCVNHPGHVDGHEAAETAFSYTSAGAIWDFLNADTNGGKALAALGVVPGGKYIAKALGRRVQNLIRRGMGHRNVNWVTENASMSPRARAYEDAALNARPGQAPAISRTLEDGTLKPVRFDGLDGNVMIDRKISIFTSNKTRNTIQRQSQALSENGMTARWEVPTQAQANRAQRLFDELGVTNIIVRVVPE